MRDEGRAGAVRFVAQATFARAGVPCTSSRRQPCLPPRMYAAPLRRRGSGAGLAQAAVVPSGRSSAASSLVRQRIHVDHLNAAASGFIGTIAMIAVMYVFPCALRSPPLDVPLFVGGLLSSRPRVAGLLGAGVLLFNGSVIACLGRLVWRFETGARGLLEGLGFGALLGLLSIAVMKVMLAVHPKATGMRVSQPMVAFTLWVGHLAYGVCVALVFAAP